MPTLLEQARQHRRASRLTGRRVRSSVRFARQQPPRAVEVAYTAWIRGILARAQAAVLQRVVPLLKAATESSAEAALADRADSRADSAERPLSELDVVRVSMAGVLSSDLLGQQIREFGTRTERYQGSELQGQIRKALGIESPILSDDKIGPLLREWIAENVRLIKTVPSEYFGSIERLVAAGVNTGRRHEQIAKQIADRYGVAQRRAALIARDQVGKFYGQVQRARQKELGIQRYRWRTSNDERVRPEHVEREGKVFEWTDPPADGHPGYPINCRCTAEPVITDVLEQLEKEEQADRERMQALQAGELEQKTPEQPLEPPAPVKPIPTGTAGAQVAKEHPELAELLGPSLHVDDSPNGYLPDVAQRRAAQLTMVPDGVLEAAKNEGITIRIGPGNAHEVALKSRMTEAQLNEHGRGNDSRRMRDVGAYFSPATNEVAVGHNMSGSEAVTIHELGHGLEGMAGLGNAYGRYPVWLDRRKKELAEQRQSGRIDFETWEKRNRAAEKIAADQLPANKAFEKAHDQWVKRGAAEGVRRPAYYSNGWTYTELPGGRLSVTDVGGPTGIGRSETFAELSAVYWFTGRGAAERRFSPALVRAWERSVKAATGVSPKAKPTNPKRRES